jgi:hypothetical protein
MVLFSFRSIGIRTAVPKGVKRHFMSALVLTFCMSPLQGATLGRLSLSDMIGKSTSIERAKITSSYAAADGPVIYTHYKLQVSEQLKGFVVSEIVVPGGTANGIRQFFAGAPQFQTGDEFVFFLWTSKSGLTQVMGLTQGLFTVAAGGGADPTVTRVASEELMLDTGTGHPVKDQTIVLKLSDLRAQVKGASQ